jgi:lambda repressor-like predicted transcriptional regulator
MTALQRKAALVLKQKKMAVIATETGTSRSHVCQVVSGIRRSARIERAVADAIGKPVQRVFPAAPTKSAAA